MALMAPDLVSCLFTACEKFMLEVDVEGAGIWRESGGRNEGELYRRYYKRVLELNYLSQTA